MKKWLAETHGVEFELIRHFLRRFFDSDLVTEPGQWTKVFVGAFALGAPAFLLIEQALRAKYAHAFRSAESYLHVVRADQLWLITLGMSIVGLLTAVQWQALFPTKRDYMALGVLPIKSGQIFVAKFTALLILIGAVIVVVNALPSLLFPAASMNRFQLNPSLAKNIEVHAATCAIASCFTFFGLLAVQGILLNIFRGEWFARITGLLQALAIVAMLALGISSFSIGPPVERVVVAPGLAEWLPQVWFLGLYQWLLGDRNPLFAALAKRALTGSAAVFATASISYLVSYRRHRELAVEGLPGAAQRGTFGGRLADILIPDPRQRAVWGFVSKTLARSGQHRIVLMGYFGFALAVTVTGIAGVRSLAAPERATLAAFVYAHMVLLLFAAAGLKKAFGIPMELRANWTFQVTEGEGRREWLRAVDQIGIYPALLAIVAVPAPIEFALLGWRGVAEAILFALAYLVLYESIFHDWQKLPFTCSYLPGKESGFVVVLRLLGILTALPALDMIIIASLYNPIGCGFVMVVLFVAWNLVRDSRRVSWSYTPMLYQDDPEPEIRGLNLGTN